MRQLKEAVLKNDQFAITILLTRLVNQCSMTIEQITKQIKG